MLLASILAPIGEGLLSTWTVDATFGQWFGYEALTGLAVGMGMQQPIIAVQTVLCMDDVPIGTSLVVFMQTLGAAVFVAVAQSVFQNRLIADLGEMKRQLAAGTGGGSFDPMSLLQAGAADIYSKVPPELVRPILEAFNDAITRVYLVSICMSSLTLLGSLAMEWKSVRGGVKANDDATPAGDD